jgi:NDP-sugar pyrophosphorylase family protein
MPKGMILAAGFGQRLRPLTRLRPKPLLPVANLPVMTYGLRALRRLGITDICVNVCYCAPDIMAAFGDGSDHGAALHWSVERDPPVGTAGGMKRVEAQLKDDVVVMVAGDAMLDLDLAPLLAAHQRAGALATLGTLQIPNPERYGQVLTDPAGRITRFHEKLVEGPPISDQANTGIYVFQPEIFDLVPPAAFCDFAGDIFTPANVAKLPFYAFPVTGYWTDIGNPDSYVQANLDYLAGRIAVEGRGQRIGDNLVDDGVSLEGCCVSNSVVGAGARLTPGTRLTDCVVWPDTVLTRPHDLQACVATPQGVFDWGDGFVRRWRRG